MQNRPAALRAALLLAAAFLVLGVMSLSGCQFGPTGRQEAASGLPPEVAARIGTEVVPLELLDLRERVMGLYFRERFDSPGARGELLDQLVQERILIQEARAQGLSLSDEAVTKELARFKGALERRYGSGEALTKAMADYGLTEADLREFVAGFLLAQAAADAFRQRVTVSEDELRRFYDQNLAALYTAADDVVRLRQILLEPDQEKLARELAGRVAAGEDFAVLAREHSVDPSTARSGGEVGYLSRADLAAVPELADLAFTLDTGAVAGPVKTAFGWHIIRVEERRGPGVIPFEVARAEILGRLLPEKQNQELARWLANRERQLGVEKAALGTAEK